MKIKCFPVGVLSTNCYLVWDETTKRAAYIDPGDEGKFLAEQLKALDLTLSYILLTHGHFDHVGGVTELHALAGGELYIHEKDLNLQSESDFPSVDLDPKLVHFYKEGDTISLDSITFHVLETPGHTPGSVCLIAGDVLFSGDTLFQGSCGRTDFPGGSWGQMMASLRRLYALPGDYTVFSGHTGSTTLERERKTNSFMLSAIQ